MIRAGQEEILARYILGRLTDEEESQIEARFFADDQFCEELLAVEDAMMDAYSQGDLPEDERKDFEEYLISSPQRLRDLGFTRNLISDVAKIRSGRETSGKDSPEGQLFLPPQPSVSFQSSWYALAAFLLIGGLSAYLLVSHSTLRKRIQQLEADLVALETTNKSASRSRQSAAVASLSLSSANLSRDGGVLPSVELAQPVGELRIQIDAPGDTNLAGYFVTLATTRGEVVWRGIVLQEDVDSGKLNVFIPVEKLQNEVYMLKLEGLTGENPPSYFGEYAFRVKR